MGDEVRHLAQRKLGANQFSKLADRWVVELPQHKKLLNTTQLIYKPSCGLWCLMIYIDNGASQDFIIYS